MHLYDTHRPTLNSHPVFLCGTIIPGLTFFPNEDPNLVTLEVFLPIEGFTCKRFEKVIAVNDIAHLILQFTLDPEQTLEELFHDSPIKPQLRKPRATNTFSALFDAL
jgi:hypothetical protein